jgi:hypothetical protein
MVADPTLREDPIGSYAVHICLDMQAVFRGPSPWSLPWMELVLPRIVDLHHAAVEVGLHAVCTGQAVRRRAGDLETLLWTMGRHDA